MNKLDQARAIYRESLNAGYSPAETAERLRVFMQTGQVPEDPTAQVWDGLIKQESGGRQSAVSPKGAVGVAQVMPATGPEAAELAGVAWDPVAYREDKEYNARIGRAYLRKQINDFGSTELGLAAYNAGPGRVRQAGGNLDALPAETRAYVPAIMGRISTTEAFGAPREEQLDTRQPVKIDSQEDEAAALEALSTSPANRRAMAQKIYAEMAQAGASPDEIKAELRKVLGEPAKKVEPVAAQPEQPPGVTPLQQDIESLYASGGRMDAGILRSLSEAGRGARQMWNRLTGDQEDLAALEQQERRSREFWEANEPQGSGISTSDIGRVMGGAMVGGPLAAGAGAALGAAAPAFVAASPVLAPTAAGIVGGAAEGALRPTLGDESRLENTAAGAAVGAVPGLIGGGVRKLIGVANPRLRAMVDSLRQRGVDVPEGMAYDSKLHNALTRLSGEGNEVGDSLSNVLAKELNPRSMSAEQLRKFFLDRGTPADYVDDIVAKAYGGRGASTLDNEFLESVKARSGQEIGALYQDAKKSLTPEFLEDLSNAERVYRTYVANPSKSDPAMSVINEMLDDFYKSSKIGGDIPMTGERYQALRQRLGSMSVSGGPEQKRVAGMLKQALDDQFSGMAPKGKYQALNRQYQMAKVLRKGAGVPDEGFTIKQLARKIESAAEKGALKEDIRELVSDVAKLAPNQRVGDTRVTQESVAPVLERAIENKTMVGLLSSMLRGVLSGSDKHILMKGGPQKLVNDPALRRIMSEIIREPASIADYEMRKEK